MSFGTDTINYTGYVNACRAVAKYFYDCIKELGVDTFAELKEVYDWTDRDVRQEVKAVCADCDVYFSDDYTIVYWIDSEVPYRQFSAKWRSLLKAHLAFGM